MDLVGAGVRGLGRVVGGGLDGLFDIQALLLKDLDAAVGGRGGLAFELAPVLGLVLVAAAARGVLKDCDIRVAGRGGLAVVGVIPVEAGSLVARDIGDASTVVVGLEGEVLVVDANADDALFTAEGRTARPVVG